MRSGDCSGQHMSRGWRRAVVLCVATAMALSTFVVAPFSYRSAHAAEVPVSDSGNTFSISGDHAGTMNTYTVYGLNQAAFFESNRDFGGDATKMPGEGTTAYIPVYATSSYGKDTNEQVDYCSAKKSSAQTGAKDRIRALHAYDASGLYFDDIVYYETLGQPVSYKRNIPKAADFVEYVYYDKWVVTQGKWRFDSDVEISQSFSYTLLGQVYYSGDVVPGKSFWVKNGEKYPKHSVKKKGYKFVGWYTSWSGGKKITPGKTTVNFGEGCYLYVSARWNRNVKITLLANGGSVSGSTKTVKYRGKYGKFPTPTRNGYRFLGWYRYYTKPSKYWASYEVKKSDTVYTSENHKFKARWVKMGKGKTVTLAEWNRFISNKDYGLEYNDVKAIFGGSAMKMGYGSLYISSTNSYVYGDRYRWQGRTSGNYVIMCFNRTTKKWNGYVYYGYFS